MTKPLRPIKFLVPELIPMGVVTFLASREGIGKTTLLTALSLQLTRAQGGEFLGRPVANTTVVYMNTDAPDGEARSVRYWLDLHQAQYPDGDATKIIVLEPKGSGLDASDFEEMKRVVKEHQAGCLIVDSFMGSFPGIDSNKLSGVMKPMMALREFAALTGVAVIITDHLPKKAVGEKDGDRGVMGSVGKTAQARAVFLLTSVPPKEVGGRKVLRLEVRKVSFARDKYSLGVEIVQTEATGTTPASVDVRLYDLQTDGTTDTRGTRAVAAVTAHLQGSSGAQVTHAELQETAKMAGDLQRRAAQDAVRQAVETMKDSITQEKLPKRGSPKAYRLKGAPGPDCHTATNTSEAVQDSIPLVAVQGCQGDEPANGRVMEGSSVEDRTRSMPGVSADESAADEAIPRPGAPGPDCHTATNTSKAVQDSVPLVAVQSCQGDEAIPWPTAAGPVFMSATPPTPAPAKLPPHLARLVEEARAGALPVNTFKLQDGNMIPNPTEYVLDWAKAFPGDNANILSKLQSVYDSLSGGAK